MYKINNVLLASRRLAHTWSHETPSATFKEQIAKIERKRKKMKILKKDELFVEVRESNAYLDQMKMPMVLTFVAVALFAKVLMTV